MISRLALPLSALLLAACSSAPPPARFPDLHFTDEQPIELAVAQVEVASDFQPTFRAPDVEHEFAVPPQRALENLARDRYHPVAPTADRRARFTIEDASVKEVKLPLAGGVQGALTTQQSERYDAHAAVKFEIVRADGFVERTVLAEATATRTVPEGITLNDRDQAWYDITRSLARDIDAQLARQVYATFPPYVH
ncbi:MAG TPA: hypothetical protein VM689_26200 [Aliidongia sp.]|nr:hypothetical protein [Aliidongia sp.]